MPLTPPDSMLVVPAEPVRDAKNTGGLLDQLDGYKGAYGACVTSMEQIAEWKRSTLATIPPEMTLQVPE
ncbi:hypothetical protein [Hartmannibacter diazotrophicus]|uniref:hypothetical protein n=1 Tax=Hartmannibacter diazotrophicus TaxID=1482074 RepID=UPI000C14787F|nr:hypothetical protein [Hartmannibacter diazotrophicus]